MTWDENNRNKNKWSDKKKEKRLKINQMRWMSGMMINVDINSMGCD